MYQLFKLLIFYFIFFLPINKQVLMITCFTYIIYRYVYKYNYSYVIVSSYPTFFFGFDVSLCPCLLLIDEIYQQAQAKTNATYFKSKKHLRTLFVESINISIKFCYQQNIMIFSSMRISEEPYIPYHKKKSKICY